MAEKEIVSSDRIFSFENVQFDEKWPTTKVGYYLAIFVLIYIALVTVIILINYLWHTPSLPAVSGLEPGVLESYDHLSNTARDQAVELFDTFVHKSMIPVLTAILGYIFGVRGSDGGE